MSKNILKSTVDKVSLVWKGCIPYRDSLILQEQLKTLAHQNRRLFLMGFECPACVTLGLRGLQSKDLTKSVEEYQKQGIEIISVKRGGQATIHSPGQLVVYPIMSLSQWKIRLRDFLGMLEFITIESLKELNISVIKKEEFAGLFTERGKIAFFGVHVSRGVSQHGLAINVNNDLSLFNLIRSCGVEKRIHDNLKNNGISVNVHHLFHLWCQKAKNVFIRKIRGGL